MDSLCPPFHCVISGSESPPEKINRGGTWCCVQPCDHAQCAAGRLNENILELTCRIDTLIDVLDKLRQPY